MDRFEIETPAGILQLLCSERGVAGLFLPPAPRAGGCRALRRRRFRGELARRISRDLARYFRGDDVSFDVPLDTRGVGAFDRRVLSVLRSIPYGETRTYGWVARRIGMAGAARAVGGACGRNPCPILMPCHRVVAADGSLGGYSSGLPWKRYLLTLEKTEKKI